MSPAQDTVVGYQGLSLYAKKTYAKHDGLEITLRTDKEGTLHRFNVAEKTRLLLQKKQLTRIPGNYTVQVTGKGCVFIQVRLSILQINAHIPWHTKDPQLSSKGFYYRKITSQEQVQRFGVSKAHFVRTVTSLYA